MMRKLLLLIAIVSTTLVAFPQGSSDYNGGLKIKFDEQGNKYLRFIIWAQAHAAMTHQNDQTRVDFLLRRARFLAYSQLGDKFMILTHFGLNTLNTSEMAPTGKSNGPQLFLHGMWVQYKVKGNHHIGAGLHYFNGISRLNNQSTLNMMTLDNNRSSWATLGLSDQFARHMGIFAKGAVKAFQYQVAINQVIYNGLDTRDPDAALNTSIYGGARLLSGQKADFNYAGYFKVDLFDKESNFLPYKVGTYLGSKKVLSIGGGFFIHPNAIVRRTALGEKLEKQGTYIVAVDVFYDAPIGDRSALTAYAVYQYNNYGDNYYFSAYGSGHMTYAHLGFLLPFQGAVRLQPYASYAFLTYDANVDNRHVPGVGINALLNAHHSKLTLEYQPTLQGDAKVHRLTLQAQIYL